MPTRLVCARAMIRSSLDRHYSWLSIPFPCPACCHGPVAGCSIAPVCILQQLIVDAPVAQPRYFRAESVPRSVGQGVRSRAAVYYEPPENRQACQARSSRRFPDRLARLHRRDAVPALSPHARGDRRHFTAATDPRSMSSTSMRMCCGSRMVLSDKRRSSNSTAVRPISSAR